MPEVGVEGQRKLKGARVLCVGAGGLGSPSSLYLAAAGVGTIGLVDFDVVDTSNLQRQVLFSTADVGRPKVEAARDRLKGLNPSLTINVHETPLRSSNALEIFCRLRHHRRRRRQLPDALSGQRRVRADRQAERLRQHLPVRRPGLGVRDQERARAIAASIPSRRRRVWCRAAPKAACWACCPGIIGVIQATEAVKLIIGAGEPLIGRLLLFDALRMTFRTLKLQRDPDCPVCGDHPTVKALIDYEQFCGITPATTAAAAGAMSSDLETTVEEFKARLDRHDDVWLLDVREKNEFDICRMPGATLIPLGELPRRLNELPQGPDAPDIIVSCKMGGAQREGGESAPGEGLRSRAEPEGRHPRLDRPDRSDAREVLTSGRLASRPYWSPLSTSLRHDPSVLTHLANSARWISARAQRMSCRPTLKST